MNFIALEIYLTSSIFVSPWKHVSGSVTVPEDMDQDLESDQGDHHHLLDYGEAVTNSHNYNIFILKFYIITASSWH